MSLYNTFGTDKTAEVDGVWLEFPDNDDGTVPRFLIARMSKSNPVYQKAVERLSKKHRRDIELNVLTESTAAPELMEVFITTILKKWENVQGPTGEVIPYSEDNARQLFKDLPDLYNYLADKARALDTFRKTELDNALGE